MSVYVINILNIEFSPVIENNIDRTKRDAHHSIKHHLISLPVLDLVVQVLRQFQTLVNVLLKPYGTLQGKKVSQSINI